MGLSALKKLISTQSGPSQKTSLSPVDARLNIMIPRKWVAPFSVSLLTFGIFRRSLMLLTLALQMKFQITSENAYRSSAMLCGRVLGKEIQSAKCTRTSLEKGSQGAEIRQKKA